MDDNFSLTKYFRDQYLQEANKSNAEKETDAMRSSTFTAYDEEGEQPYLKESRVDQSKIFDQSEIEEIIGEIREITGILEDGFNSDVEYQEFRFSSGEGGFSFKWAHSRNWGGRFGLSINKDGNYLSAISYYNKNYFGKEKIKSSNTFVQNIETWRDLDDQILISIWAQLQPLVKKNEEEAKLALDREAKAQADYYGAKADTGRIGYGLTQQPRMRNEASINDPVLVKARAAKTEREKIASAPKPKKMRISRRAAELVDGFELEDLERNLRRIYRDMEQEAEAEGGPIADQYADEIDTHEQAIRFIKNQGKEKAQMTYDQAIKESTESKWNAVDVSRKAEKEIGNKEWNERTTKKLDMLKSLNKAGKFKKDWDEDKLQGWVDKNYSWEKLSQQFKINEGSCGYTPDGKPRSKPAGPDLMELKEKIFNSLKK